MKHAGIGLALGLLLGLLLSWVSPAVAQAPSRIFGTSTTGAAVPIGADSSGNLKVVCQ
jgi:hypothetical protein